MTLIKARTIANNFALPLMLLSASGCLALSGRCLFESRNVITRGSVVEAGDTTLAAELIVGEQRDFEPDKDFHWQITGIRFVGHVQSISFVDNAAKSTMLFDLPVFTGQQPTFLVSSGAVTQSNGANLNGFFDILSKGRGLLLIRTDLPGKALIEVPLPVYQQQDWTRPYCS
jgi:hypothetical protein